VRGDVCEERDDIEQLWCGVHRLSLSFTKLCSTPALRS
jgi:hypothetical protein